MKEKFIKWIQNHPESLFENEWFCLSNALGTLGIFTWEELDEIYKDFKK